MAFIAVDFDGTCVENAFPYVGRDIGAAPVLKALIEKGHKLILWTVRTNVDDPTGDREDPNIILEPGKYLDDAVAWFKENNIELHSINENPSQRSWSTSPKVYVHMYIDDLALGTPLSKAGYVDWYKIKCMLEAKGYL